MGKLSKFLYILKCLFLFLYSTFDLLNYISTILGGTPISIYQLMELSSFRVLSFSLSYPGKVFSSRDFPTLCNSLVPSIFHGMEQLLLQFLLLPRWLKLLEETLSFRSFLSSTQLNIFCKVEINYYFLK